MNIGNATVYVLHSDAVFSSVAPRTSLQLPSATGNIAVCEIDPAKSLAKLAGLPVPPGATVLWGDLVVTPPEWLAGAHGNDKALPSGTIEMPAAAKQLLLKRRKLCKGDTIVPMEWNELMIGEIVDGIRVQNAGCLSVIAGEHASAFNEAGMLLRWVPPGSFVRASQGAGAAASRSIVLTRGYWVSATELTRAQQSFSLGTPLPPGAESELPAVNVTWNDAVKLGASLSLCATGSYRLPTEAEWENAAQAGKLRKFGSDAPPEKQAWYGSNARSGPHKVATKLPNDWGIYDMHGNVREWCADYWVKDPPAGNDPIATAVSSERVRRGGCYECPIEWCRSGLRDSSPPWLVAPYHGVRLVSSMVVGDSVPVGGGEEPR